MDQTYKEQVVEAVRRVPIFSALTDSELGEIVSRMTVKRFKRNGIVLYEEDTNEYMYLILSGKVKVIQSTEGGREVILAFHRSGDFFGEMSLIDRKTTEAIVVATEDSTIAIISRDTFLSLLQGQGKVVAVMLQILCGRLRESWERIQILSFSNASQKVKMLLHLLSDDHGQKVKEGTILKMKLTHQDIANMTGVSRETVTRIIDKWNKGGEIRVCKDRALLLRDEFMAKGVKDL